MRFDPRARRGISPRATAPEPGERRRHPLLGYVIAVTGVALATLLGLTLPRAWYPAAGAILLGTGLFALAGGAVAALAARFRAPGALDTAAATRLVARSREAKLMVEQVREYAILGIDPEGRIMSWNEGAVQVRGDQPAELLGMSAQRLFTPEDQAAGVGPRAERYPGVPVVYLSGDSAAEMARRGLLAPGAPVLTKPFTPRELVERVREVLDRVPRNR